MKRSSSVSGYSVDVRSFPNGTAAVLVRLLHSVQELSERKGIYVLYSGY